MNQDYKNGYEAGQRGGPFPTQKPGQTPQSLYQQQIGYYHAEDDRKKK